MGRRADRRWGIFQKPSHAQPSSLNSDRFSGWTWVLVGCTAPLQGPSRGLLSTDGHEACRLDPELGNPEAKDMLRHRLTGNLQLGWEHRGNTADSLYHSGAFYKVTANIESAITEPPLLGETRGEVPASLWSHFHRLVLCVFLFKADLCIINVHD